MSERKPTPRDFPLMRTAREVAKLGRWRSQYSRCSVCGLYTTHRNRERHRKACARRKRLAPALWREWRDDMRA